MTFRLPTCARTAVIVGSACAALATTHARAQQGEQALVDQTFQGILSCLSHSLEVVFRPALTCVPYGRGDAIARNAGMPLGERTNWDDVCRNPEDPRLLRPDLIKRIVGQKEVPIGPAGIRIIGGVFCGDLDLIGLELPYSLVIDRSVINGTLDAQNFHTRADFSFDNAVVLNSMYFTRARVEGSVYGSGSFLGKLVANDTQVNGAWWQTESVVFTDYHMNRTTIAGDLRLNDSAFTQLSISSSTVGGMLLLDNTEARCAYHISSSAIRFLMANRAGFGQMRAAPQTDGPPVDYPWWQRALSASRPNTRQLLESAMVQRIMDAKLREIKSKPVRSVFPLLRGCEDTSGSTQLEFHLFNNKIATLWISSFAWLAPKNALPDDAHPVSVLALNGTKVEGNLILDLWGDSDVGIARLSARDAGYWRTTTKQRFVAVGLTAETLFYNFSDSDRPYFTCITGLNFDGVYDARNAVSGTDSMTPVITQMQLPSLANVFKWLDKNGVQSGQPLAAFASAFQKANEDATELNVHRKTLNLYIRTASFFGIPTGGCWSPRDPASPSVEISVDTDTSDPSSGLSRFIRAPGEVIALIFDWGLYVLVDHGMRPAKIVWPVAGTLIIFLLLFWFKLRIVGFEPKGEDDAQAAPVPRVWPISFLFLFDRLIPLYRIREQHYAIAKFYRRATDKEVKAAPREPGGPPYAMSYFGRKISVWAADDADKRRAEKILVVLRILGAFFTVYLLAAIKELLPS